METALRLLNEGRNSCKRFLEREVNNLAYYEGTKQTRLANNASDSIEKWKSRIVEYDTAISELETLIIPQEA